MNTSSQYSTSVSVIIKQAFSHFNIPFPDDYGNLIDPYEQSHLSNSAFLSRAYFYIPQSKYHYIHLTKAL